MLGELIHYIALDFANRGEARTIQAKTVNMNNFGDLQLNLNGRTAMSTAAVCQYDVLRSFDP